jgi:hypothetical protein
MVNAGEDEKPCFQLQVNVVRKTMKILGRKSEDLIRLLEGKTVQDLIDSGDLVRFFKFWRRYKMS